MEITCAAVDAPFQRTGIHPAATRVYAQPAIAVHDRGIVAQENPQPVEGRLQRVLGQITFLLGPQRIHDLKAQKSGETRLREDTVAAAATHAGEGPSEILTANWDQTLERWLKANGKRPKVFHVHGSIKKPSTMLLPGEAPWDIHRDKADNAYFRKTYEVAMGHFAFARRIYVAGLGLSPSDAALGTALNEGLQARGRVAGSSKEPGEVVVVNLKKDMERIVAQVRMLVPDGWTLREESVG